MCSVENVGSAITLKDWVGLAVGGGVLTSLVAFAYQSWRSQRQEDERRLADARVLLMQLINLRPNEPFAPIHTGDPHEGARAGHEWRNTLDDVRTRLENTALGIRGGRHRALAAKILEVAEPPLGEWDEDQAGILVAHIKTELGPKVVAARKDPHALTDNDD